MPSQVDNEKFKQSLMEDLSQAQAQSQKSADALGVQEQDDFQPRALRIKNRTVGQKELEDSKRAIESTIKELTAEAGIHDELEAGKFEYGLTKKMRQYQMHLIRQAGEFNRQMTRQKMDEEERQAAIAAFGQLVSGATENIISRMGRKKKPFKPTDFGRGGIGDGHTYQGGYQPFEGEE